MWDNLKASIASVVRTNNNQEITGENLQSVLNTIVNSVGANATFAGVATPSTNPGTPDGPVFWLVGQAGQYSNFNNTTVSDGILGVFVFDSGVWAFIEIIDIGTISTFDSLNDLDGKTDEQKRAMVPNGKAITEIVNVISSTTYETVLISSDFITHGFYKINGNSIEFGSSDSWRCKIIPVDELHTSDAIAVNPESQTAQTVDIPAVIYLSANQPIWANYVGKEYGTKSVSGGSGAGAFRQLEHITIPRGATHAIINNTMTWGPNATVTYKYRQSIRDNVEALEKRFVVVDKNGNGDFTTIADAVNGTNDGDTIIVNAGTYEEEVHMWGKTRHIVGVDRDACILTNGTGNYLTPPLEANIGSVANMTIIADNYNPTIQDPSVYQERASYGIHIEYANSTAYTLSIRNCKIVSKWSAALGIGLRYNQTVEIIDCELISNSERVYSSYAGHWVEMGGLFFHNDNSNNVSGTGKLFVRNSRLQGKKAALVMEAVNKTTMVDAEFDCNTFISEDYGVGTGIIYRYDNMVTQEGYLCGNKITLAIASHANNIEELNA